MMTSGTPSAKNSRWVKRGGPDNDAAGCDDAGSDAGDQHAEARTERHRRETSRGRAGWPRSAAPVAASRARIRASNRPNGAAASAARSMRNGRSSRRPGSCRRRSRTRSSAPARSPPRRPRTRPARLPCVASSTCPASIRLPRLTSPLPPSLSNAMRSQLVTAMSVISPTVTTSVSRPYSVWSISRVATTSKSSAEMRVSRIAGA